MEPNSNADLKHIQPHCKHFYLNNVTYKTAIATGWQARANERERERENSDVNATLTLYWVIGAILLQIFFWISLDDAKTMPSYCAFGGLRQLLF